jgi:hypothetical protein
MAGVARSGKDGRGPQRGSSSPRVPVRSVRHSTSGNDEYARECLARLARILVHTGHSPQKLWRDFRGICGALKEPAHAWDPTRLTYFADLPHVIAYWHSDPQYLDREGNPSGLPLRGRGRSLSALIERVLPGEEPAAVAAALVRLKGVRRRGGLYMPTQRHLAFSNTSAHVHGLNTLMGMLRTVEHNVADERPRILERAAMNPGVPVSELPALHAWVKAFGDQFLWNVDRYMQLREAKDKKGPRVRVGVGVYAYESPVVPAARRRRKTRPKRAGARQNQPAKRRREGA